MIYSIDIFAGTTQNPAQRRPHSSVLQKLVIWKLIVNNHDFSIHFLYTLTIITTTTATARSLRPCDRPKYASERAYSIFTLNSTLNHLRVQTRHGTRFSRAHAGEIYFATLRRNKHNFRHHGKRFQKRRNAGKSPQRRLCVLECVLSAQFVCFICPATVYASRLKTHIIILPPERYSRVLADP